MKNWQCYSLLCALVMIVMELKKRLPIAANKNPILALLDSIGDFGLVVALYALFIAAVIGHHRDRK